MARLILIGPPGAGKGTQARMLEERLGVPHISSGDLLRNAVGRDTPEGREAKKYMERGLLVPDAVVVTLIEERLRAGKTNGFLLDGFPRNVVQAETLDRMLDRLSQKVQRVISISLPDEDVVRRLCGRRTCRECGAMYHEAFDPPKKAGQCDKCQGNLYQREDDHEETIRERLAVFIKETQPVLDYYRARGLLCEVSGLGSPRDILERIVEQVTRGS